MKESLRAHKNNLKFPADIYYQRVITTITHFHVANLLKQGRGFTTRSHKILEHPQERMHTQINRCKQNLQIQAK